MRLKRRATIFYVKNVQVDVFYIEKKRIEKRLNRELIQCSNVYIFDEFLVDGFSNVSKYCIVKAKGIKEALSVFSKIPFIKIVVLYDENTIRSKFVFEEFKKSHLYFTEYGIKNLSELEDLIASQKFDKSTLVVNLIYKIYDHSGRILDGIFVQKFLSYKIKSPILVDRIVLLNFGADFALSINYYEAVKNIINGTCKSIEFKLYLNKESKKPLVKYLLENYSDFEVRF